MLMYPHLFKPFKIRNTVFRNRIIAAPIQTSNKWNGFQTYDEMAFFEAKARGGAAQITVGETTVDPAYSAQPWTFTLDIHNPATQPNLSCLAHAIKRHGAIASIELAHPGIQALADPKVDQNSDDDHTVAMGKRVSMYDITNIIHTNIPVGPVDGVRTDGIAYRAMSKEDIAHCVEMFARSAEICQRAGFDMCMIHGAHGWLVSQFLSAHLNTRTDEYGGSIENRARLLLEIADAIHERCGRDFLIELRISDELVDYGINIDEVVQVAKLCEGHVDLIHVSAGHHNEISTSWRTFPQAIFTKPGCNVYLAEKVKQNTTIPVITVGGINTPELAESIIAEGRADFVALGRALVADPDFPNKARSGHPELIRPCLRCSECMNAVRYNSTFRCAVNAEAAFDFQARNQPAPKTSKQVVIVGGGPAGMEAAITAAQDGHRVTLLEKSGELGGLLKISDRDPHKADMKKYKDYLAARTCALADVRLNTPATAELVASLHPDVLLLAVGSSPIAPRFKGAETNCVMTALDAYHNLTKVGKKIVIVGGGLVGCELGLLLGDLGKEVTIVEMRKQLGDMDGSQMHTLPMLMTIEQMENVTGITEAKCSEITANGVIIETEAGERLLPADTVITSVGMRSNLGEMDELWQCAPIVLPIGDAIRAGKIKDAVLTGHQAAKDLNY